MIDGYDEEDFAYEGKVRRVYRRGAGPGVLVLHELPGIHPTVVRFANWVVDAGFTVLIPELVGKAGKPISGAYVLRSFARVCIGREFRLLAANRASPITQWLRALCRHTHEEIGGPGVGAVGMCITGNFVLAMMLESSLIAPVLSQPSLPLPLGAKRKASLHLSAEELAAVKRRTEQGCPVLGLRFSEDYFCPRERFDRLGRELGDQFEHIELDSKTSLPGSAPWGPHSVLTEDFNNGTGHPTVQARDRVIEFLRQRLAK